MGAVRRVVVDRSRSLQAALDGGHTRWHPDIAPIARIVAGEVVVMDARDGSDVQIGADTTEADLAHYDLDRLHPLTGPFYVEGVEPGDLLEVEIIDITPPTFAWSRVSPGGGGLMRRFVHDSLLVKWRLADGVARSPDLPGVAIRGAPFVGTIGVAPSMERLAAIARREAALRQAGGWALAPDAKNAVPSTTAVQNTGLRTLPPREFGGNMDIKDVCAGGRVSFVADVPGGLLSLGDLHFAQGDGESFGTAIEMAGVVEFRCSVRKAADLKWTPRSPLIETPGVSVARDARRYIITTGVSVDADDHNGYLDLNLAAQNALNEMTAYLTRERGYSEAQAQVLVSVAGDLRINVVNNPPNPLVSVALPLDIFEDSRARGLELDGADSRMEM
jgi:formamidase